MLPINYTNYNDNGSVCLTMEMLSPAKLPANSDTQLLEPTQNGRLPMKDFGLHTYLSALRPEAQAALPEIQNTPKPKLIRKSCRIVKVDYEAPFERASIFMVTTKGIVGFSWYIFSQALYKTTEAKEKSIDSTPEATKNWASEE